MRKGTFPFFIHRRHCRLASVGDPGALVTAMAFSCKATATQQRRPPPHRCGRQPLTVIAMSRRAIHTTTTTTGSPPPCPLVSTPSASRQQPFFVIHSVMDSFDFAASVRRQSQTLVEHLQNKALHEAATTAKIGRGGIHSGTPTDVDLNRILPEGQRIEIQAKVSREWEPLQSLSVREVEDVVWGKEHQGGWGLKNEMLTTCLVPYAVATKIILERMPVAFREMAQRELEHEETVRATRMAIAKASKESTSQKSTTSSPHQPQPPPSPPPIPRNTFIQWKDIDMYRRKVPMVTGPYQRPPVVSIMGHIDHGKTTLLDTLMKSNLCSREAGRITQSVRAFTINMAMCVSSLRGMVAAGGSGGDQESLLNEAIVPTTPYPSKLTIIDTPGHKAFSEMRLHSQLLSDYVLLLVALDEGIQGQTVEIVHVALNADRPIIVVFNKADKFSDMRILATKLAVVLEELKREGLHVRIVHDSKDLESLGRKPSKKHLGATVAEVYLLKQSKLDAKVLQHHSSSSASSLSSSSQTKGSTTIIPKQTSPPPQQRRGTLYDPVIESGSLKRRSLGVCISGLTGRNVELLLDILSMGARLDTPHATSGDNVIAQAQILEATKTVEGSAEAAELGERVHGSKRRHQKHQDNDNTETLQRQLSSRGNQGQQAADRALNDFSSSLMIITAIVRSGTLRPGMAFVADQAFGKVSMLCDYWGNRLSEALPGTAVVIVDSNSKSGCPGVGTHVIHLPTLAAASYLNEYRRQLQWFVQTFPHRTALLRPAGTDSRFMALGNYGQVDKKEDEKSLPYKLLYGGGERAEKKERENQGRQQVVGGDEDNPSSTQPNAAATAISPSTDVEGTPEHIEKKWSSLQPERFPQTEQEMKEMQENAKIVGVYLKVDTWHSARILSREIPRMSTKHVIFNVVGARFGALTEDDLPHFGSSAQVIISYRTPKMSSSKVHQHMEFSKAYLLETSLYSDVITFLKTTAIEKHEEYIRSEFRSDTSKYHSAKTAAIIQSIGLSIKVGGSITDHNPTGNSGNGSTDVVPTVSGTDVESNAATSTSGAPPQIVSRRRSKVALARGYNPDATINPYEN